MNIAVDRKNPPKASASDSTALRLIVRNITSTFLVGYLSDVAFGDSVPNFLFLT